MCTSENSEKQGQQIKDHHAVFYSLRIRGHIMVSLACGVIVVAMKGLNKRKVVR